MILYRIWPLGASGYGAVQIHQGHIGGESIDVYNHGEMHRDFTYIDDIAEAIVRLQAVIPQADPSWTVEQDRRRPVPHRIMFIISAITRLLN